MKKYFKKLIVVGLSLTMSLSVLSLNRISVNAKEDVEKTASYYKEIDKAVQAPRNYNSLTLEQKAIYDKSVEIEVAKYRGGLMRNDSEKI